MSDRRHPEHTRSGQERTDQTQRLHQLYPPYTDPAYGGQSFYPPPDSSGSSPDPNLTNPTDRLPQYWLQGHPPPDQTPQVPEHGRPKAPRWLWIAAVAAVVLVAALVIALVIANGTARKQTAVPALPSPPSSQRPVPATSTSPAPSASAPATTEPSQPADASAMQTVIYNVTGDGRAISITYVDNDGMMQTEFNVALPWTKEVSLPDSGSRTPNVTIVNIGHDVTCSVTVDGLEIIQRSGVGLTICNGSG
ncbi:MAG TPA: MmpS family transport accessory protein [Mycobacterium sp.]|uniref:MmpS family transport accessory protein n=1 Tax=Mycobacterium sp. TaxID=1785 RepID=UPI002F411714